MLMNFSAPSEKIVPSCIPYEEDLTKGMSGLPPRTKGHSGHSSQEKRIHSSSHLRSGFGSVRLSAAPHERSCGCPQRSAEMSGNCEYSVCRVTFFP